MAITLQTLRRRLGGPGYLNDMAPAMTATEVHRLFHPKDKDNAINEAISLSGLRWPRHVEDTSLTALASTYTYSLDSLTVPMDPEMGIDFVSYNGLETGTGVPFIQIDDDYWEVRTSGTSYTLQLVDTPPVGRTIRLTYRVRPSTLASDASTLTPDSAAFANYILAKAAALILRNPIEWVTRDQQRYYEEKLKMFEEMAEGIYNQDRPQTAPGKVILPDWGPYGSVYTNYTNYPYGWGF